MHAVIFVNGILDYEHDPADLLKDTDLIIAADGGAVHCQDLNITPDILIGDLDSIDPALVEVYSGKNVTIHRHPKKKDATDLELAIDLAVEKGAWKIRLLGALGGRWDMSIGNILLAAADKYQKQQISLIDRNCSLRILHPGNDHHLSGAPGRRVSLVPLKDDAQGVTLSGFQYPLRDHTIPFGSSLGISNIMTDSTAVVQHKGGVLLCILFDK